MASVLPQRPQRRSVASKTESKSAGLLVDVIRTLTTSPSQAQKELQRERLEKDFAVTSHNIDRLVSEHQHDLTSSLQTFRKVSVKLKNAHERVRSLKNNLSSCKSLLQCKRDELKQLWFESAEQNRVVKLLEIIESVRQASRDVDEAVGKKLFLKASQLLIRAENNIQDYLLDVEGIHQVKESVERRYKETYEEILRQIDKQLYAEPLAAALRQIRRATSLRRASGGIVLEEVVVTPSSVNRRPQSSSTSSRLSFGESHHASTLEEGPVLMDDGLAYEDHSAIDPASDTAQYIGILFDSLGVLGKLSEGVEIVKANIARGLDRMSQHMTVFVYEHYASMSESQIGDSRLLADLLQLLFRQFKTVASLLQYATSQIRRAQTNCRHQRDRDFEPYDQKSVWRQVQLGLQNVLADYLEPDHKTAEGVASVHNASSGTLPSFSNMSVYFGKRRLLSSMVGGTGPGAASAVKKTAMVLAAPFFRFDATAHALTSRTYANQRRRRQSSFDWAPVTNAASVGDDDRNAYLVCRPDPDNLALVFRPVMRMVTEVEGKSGEAPCMLRTYLEDFTRDIFLPKLRRDTEIRLDASLRDPDAWDLPASMDELAVAGAVPVQHGQEGLPRNAAPLRSAARALIIGRQYEALVQSAPAFAEHFADGWAQLLREYAAAARRAYDRATGGAVLAPTATNDVNFSHPSAILEKRKISASWAIDEDISRLLKSLPNWLALSEAGSALQHNGANSAAPTPSSGSTAFNGTSHAQRESSTSEIRQRNQRESEILISNLGAQKRIDDHELILEDQDRIRRLAALHESVEWLARQSCLALRQMAPQTAGRLRSEARVIASTNSGNASAGATFTNAYDQLERAVNGLFDTSATCLLMLHLEIRVHCFYFVLNVASIMSSTGQLSGNKEIDDWTLRLNKDLLQYHESVGSTLQQRKVKYIFEGLGHLVSSIFINSAPNIPKLNESSKKRICRDIFAIQQCLSGLTGSRESDLDAARRFFELLYKTTPDDILNGILENGPEFKESDYQNLLALFVRSNPSYANEPGTLEKRLTRLREIMREKQRR